MQTFTVNEIREKYLAFFESKGHLRLPSFSLIPENDPSILLINAGMTPMKKWFTQVEKPPRGRVTTCQKCIRTPDIERVGHTARHGTFFEMLGNFSFGDYFKKEIIPWAWELCTEVFKLPEERLYVTVYKDDEEAWELWRNTVGLPESHIFRFGKEDNFWEHGTGPCGPCSEIFFDRGEKYGCGKPDCTVGCECDRYLEFWNLVFTQFDRQEDGRYLPLAHKNIDTGAGLERFAMVLQGAENFFEVDNIRAILDHTAELAGRRYGDEQKTDIALRVVTDHIRSTTFMIADGIVPSNEGRGYVLRRLLRRAARYGRLLDIPTPFLGKLSELVIAQSQGAYPELAERRERILEVIEQEELSFDQTIQQGLSLLEEDLHALKSSGGKILEGERVFRLHDTYGFPLDLTREIAEEHGYEVDIEGFNRAMSEQKAMGREAQLRKSGSAWEKMSLPENVKQNQKTQFTGYETLTGTSSLLYLLSESQDALREVKSLKKGEKGFVIFAETPFYAESGGQIGDRGEIHQSSGKAKVLNTEKTGDGIYLHEIEVTDGEICQGSMTEQQVDKQRRLDTQRNHTATHLLHKALRDILGTHVEQAGSYVSPERLRFDFRHNKAMSSEEIRKVEEEVNAAILEDYPVVTEIMDLDTARRTGAMALFSEKYGDRVRVVEVGDFSRELCGGTHLSHSSQAGFFRILSESGVASGVRRIEAVTGTAACASAFAESDELSELSDLLKTDKEQLLPRVDKLLEERKNLEKELQAEMSRQTASKAKNLASEAEEINGVKVILSEIQAESPVQLREAGDSLKAGQDPILIVLAAKNENKVLWLAMASEQALKRGLHCGNLIREAARMTGGGGGGRPDMAQAGGKDPEKIPEALEALRENIRKVLA